MNSVSVSSENKEVEFTCVVPPAWMWTEAVCIKDFMDVSHPLIDPNENVFNYRY